MSEYYRYLWRSTWPNLVVLALIWVLVLSRLIWKSRKTWLSAHHVWGFLLLSGKVLVWLFVLAVFTKLLLFSQPDWFAKPGMIQGTIAAKSFDAGSNAYFLDIKDGSVQKKLYIDKNAYEQLKVKDQVKILYLPVRREVISCEILGSLH
jgi:hypothetical protein